MAAPARRVRAAPPEPSVLQLSVNNVCERLFVQCRPFQRTKTARLELLREICDGRYQGDAAVALAARPAMQLWNRVVSLCAAMGNIPADWETAFRASDNEHAQPLLAGLIEVVEASRESADTHAANLSVHENSVNQLLLHNVTVLNLYSLCKHLGAPYDAQTKDAYANVLLSYLKSHPLYRDEWEALDPDLLQFVQASPTWGTRTLGTLVDEPLPGRPEAFLCPPDKDGVQEFFMPFDQWKEETEHMLAQIDKILDCLLRRGPDAMPLMFVWRGHSMDGCAFRLGLKDLADLSAAYAHDQAPWLQDGADVWDCAANQDQWDTVPDWWRRVMVRDRRHHFWRWIVAGAAMTGTLVSYTSRMQWQRVVTGGPSNVPRDCASLIWL